MVARLQAILISSLLLAGALPAQAEMKITNLTRVDTKAFDEAKWLVRKEASRLTIACNGCSSMTAIDTTLSASPAGMEQRIRSGQTTAQTMLEICRQNAGKTGAECYGLKPANMGKAVGFVSDVKIFEGVFSATYTLYQDGRMLLMRCVGPSRQEARRMGNLAFKEIAPQIVR